MSFHPGALTLRPEYLVQHELVDVCRGTLARPGQSSEEVVAKMFRRSPDDEDANRQLSSDVFREESIQRSLFHPNIVPCYGSIQTSRTDYPCLLFPFYPKGKVMEYRKAHPNANKLRLVANCAAGLDYMHSLGKVHGDITPSNILVDEKGNARLTNFWLAKVPNDPRLMTEKPATSLRHMAVELLSGASGSSFASDVWAFAMSAIEIISGRPPFEGYDDAHVLRAVLHGRRPLRSDFLEISDRVWSRLAPCWTRIPSQRPSMRQLCIFFTAEAGP